IAKNICKGGYEMWIRDPFNRASVESLLSMGAHEAVSPKDMAEKCDVIQICLPSSQHVESVVRGDDGIIAGARSGLIVIDASTADPGSTANLAIELSEKGARLVDAPLGRTPKEAEEGKLDAMVGCDMELLEIVRPIIECWAGSITHVGPLGSGHKMKLLMNFIGMSYGALFSEAVVLGAKVGISPNVIREVIGPSRMGNGFFDTFMRYVVDRDRDAHKFTIANAAKDLRYVTSMAAEAQVVSIMASAARHYYAHVEAIGRATDFVPMLSDHVGALNGLNLAETVR
ncbi:MAG: NAD(P)-dependent oxidoreductase, partial [Mesorhizobium sp.]